MMWADIYKEQTARYEFASKFVYGRVLDITYGSYMSYQASKILLSKNVKELIGLDIINHNVELFCRKYGIDKNIDFEPIDQSFVFENESFDCIISSDVIQYSNNSHETLKEYNRLLKNNGLLIISTANKEGFTSLYGNMFDGWNDDIFTKNEFIMLLEKIFTKYTLYSQRIISHNELVSRRIHCLVSNYNNLRKLLSRVLLKFDEKSNFYQRYLQKKIVKIDYSLNQINQEILDLDYNLTPYQNSHNQLFVVALCTKN